MKYYLVLFIALISINIIGNVGEDQYQSLQGKRMLYTNHYDGKQVGKLHLNIKKAGDSETSVEVSNAFHIRAYLLFTYKYKSNIKMIFNAMGIKDVQGKTNNDGKKSHYKAKLANGQLKAKNLRNKKDYTVGAFTGLNLNFIQTPKMLASLTSGYKNIKVLNLEKGRLANIKIKKSASKSIKVYGKNYSCTLLEWKMGNRKGKSFYDQKTGVLVKSVVTKKGNTMIMKLKSIN